MTLRPLHDRLLVKRVDEDEKTRGGLIIPETAKQKPIQGKIIAVGPGKRLDGGERAKLEVKKGDKVLFGKYAGTEIEFDGEDHLIIREDEVLAVLE